MNVFVVSILLPLHQLPQFDQKYVSKLQPLFFMEVAAPLYQFVRQSQPFIYILNIQFVYYWRFIQDLQTNQNNERENKERLLLSQNIIFMRSTSKQNKAKSQKFGNSQFTRAKLDQEYNPTFRIFKHHFMSLNQLPEQEKHSFKSKEQMQMCDKALAQIKQGNRITLDWNTKTNFRTTKSMFPKLKTEPIEILNNSCKKVYQKNNGFKDIQRKRDELSKLLFKRHNKLYMMSSSQRVQHIKFFSDSSTQQAKSRVIKNERGYSNGTKISKLSEKQQRVQQVQDQILAKSTLKILKDDLKQKFQEIRQSFHKKKKFKRHPIARFIEQ